MDKLLFLSLYFLCSLSANSQKDIYPDSTLKIKNQGDWARNRYFERVDDFKAKPIGFNKIVLLGNSIIKGGGDWNKRLGTSNIVNRGISGDITEGVLERLDEIEYYKPLAVFLLIGFNNLFTDYNSDPEITPDYISNNIIKIAEIIKKVSPKTDIFIQTIMPINNEQYIKTTASYSFLLSSYKPSINKQIKRVNSLLINNDEFKIIDLHPKFTNQKGILDRYLSNDGVHPNENGYSTWVEILRPYIKEINN